MTYLSRETAVSELLERIALQCDTTTSTNDYGDFSVVWIADGGKFLDYVTETGAVAILTRLASDGYISSDTAEADREAEDVMDFCRMAPRWRTSLDPRDGSIRFYCD